MSYVVGVDGSGPAEVALKWAMTRAFARSESVLLVHVIEDEWGLAGGDFAREALYAGEVILQDTLKRAQGMNGVVEITGRILHGSPVWELANACGPNDLLIVGTHKTGFLHGRVLGSRSVSLAGSAPCSVMVVPSVTSLSRHGVVAGVIWGDGLDLAVSSAGREAARLDEPLVLVHASPARQDGIVDAEEGPRQRELLARAKDVARSVAPGITVHTRVTARHPVDALLEASHYARMLVLEPSRRSDLLRGSMIGSTTHGVLMNINSPVLVARSAVV